MNISTAVKEIDTNHLVKRAKSEGWDKMPDAFSQQAYDRAAKINKEIRGYTMEPYSIDKHTQQFADFIKEFIEEPWSGDEWIKLADRPYVTAILDYLEVMLKIKKAHQGPA